MTAEDPVEFNLVGINQVQVRENIGLNFAAALRSFLRQDPNIILVGEIRDFETAEIAVKAALTGPPRALDAAHQRRAEHHQPADEHGHRAVPRRQLGEPDLRAAPRAPHLRQLQAQRASARRRRRSSRPASPPDEARDGACRRRAPAARRCNDTGYKGRVGLYEVMEITDELRELILVGASGLELRRKAVDEGMITLRRSGLHKVMEGVTTIEEVARETVQVRNRPWPDTARPAERARRASRAPTCTSSTEYAAAGAGPRQAADARPAGARTGRDEGARLQRADRRAEEALRGDAGARLLASASAGWRRFRCNVFNQRGAVAAVYRLIPETIRSFQELGLPPVLATLSDRPRGLVLVTGPTGSGKSTTLAAMIDKINTERREHILTIEDPIEYHPPAQGLPGQPARSPQRHARLRAARCAPRCAKTPTSC